MANFLCDGYWNSNGEHTGESFECMVISDGTWDGLEDAKDEEIFFYTDGLPVVGNHGDFTIVGARILK